MRSLRVTHLYADLLRTYGDRGNVLALARRARLRGFDVDARAVGRGEPMPETDVIILGGGSDRVQTVVGDDLFARRSALQDHVARGGVILGICGGYQLLGTGYRAVSGEMIEGLGMIDALTEAGATRMIGRVSAHCTLDGMTTELLGFENHAGRTTLGPGAQPLAIAGKDHGNNGLDGTEGARAGTIFGTYLHGPILPLNPAFTDHLLRLALRAGELAPLPDVEEEAARAAFLTRALPKGGRTRALPTRS